MRRKIAFGIAAVMTVVLAVLRMGVIPGWHSLHLGPVKADYLLICAVALVTVAIFALCRTQIEPVKRPHGVWRSLAGWFSTFFGAVLSFSVLLDVYSWLFYNQVPPPNTVILHVTDLITLIGTLLFGALAGVFLIWQGFCWMTASHNGRVARKWLALAPVLWMWFRLARYEVSYASTIDIGENFFDFAMLIFGLVFLLEYARFVSRVGQPPHTGLLVSALCTAMVGLSGTVSTLTAIGPGEPLSRLLIAIVDITLGAFALYIALLQLFGPPEKEPAASSPTLDKDDVADADLSWTQPVSPAPPLSPPFDIHAVMPPEVHAPASSGKVTVPDDLPDLTFAGEPESSDPASSVPPGERVSSVSPDKPENTVSLGEPEGTVSPGEPSVSVETERTGAPPASPVPSPSVPAQGDTEDLSVDDLLGEIDDLEHRSW